MTDKARLAALEAVAEAARVWCQAKARTDEMHYAMVGALAAPDALPADPARGEVVGMVEVALFGTAQGARCLADPSSGFASKLIMDGWRRLDTVPLVKGDGA